MVKYGLQRTSDTQDFRTSDTHGLQTPTDFGLQTPRTSDTHDSRALQTPMIPVGFQTRPTSLMGLMGVWIRGRGFVGVWIPGCLDSVWIPDSCGGGFVGVWIPCGGGFVGVWIPGYLDSSGFH